MPQDQAIRFWVSFDIKFTDYAKYSSSPFFGASSEPFIFAISVRLVVFRNQCWVHFTTSGPVADTNGQVSASEGCSSISDPAGNLLFYTDGITVFDSNHDIMPNGSGLFGGTSASNSAVIVPKPGSSTHC